MNPIFFFDELDKIPNTKEGIAIMNKLVEITDFSQNHEFEDIYYNGIKFDLSKCLFVFSLNNLNNVDPILRDRLEIIHADKFDKNDKFHICKNFIIPEFSKLYSMDNLIFTDNIIKYIINEYSHESGVRTLKRCIEKIYRKINTQQLLKKTGANIKLYNSNIMTLNKKTIRILLGNSNNKNDISKQMYL